MLFLFRRCLCRSSLPPPPLHLPLLRRFANNRQCVFYAQTSWLFVLELWRGFGQPLRWLDCLLLSLLHCWQKRSCNRKNIILNSFYKFTYIITVFSESAIATIITGSVGILAVLIIKFKCLVQCDGCCTVKSFVFSVFRS